MKMHTRSRIVIARHGRGEEARRRENESRGDDGDEVKEGEEGDDATLCGNINLLVALAGAPAKKG